MFRIRSFPIKQEGRIRDGDRLTAAEDISEASNHRLCNECCDEGLQFDLIDHEGVAEADGHTGQNRDHTGHDERNAHANQGRGEDTGESGQ